MNLDYLRVWSSTLRGQAVPLGPGLRDAEIIRVESTYGFRFPADLKVLLQEALPLGKDFPNWRIGPEEDLRRRLSWPFEGLCFDVEHNGIWLQTWGPKPEALEDALAQIQRLVACAPALIPIFGHRYIATEPQMEGNAVISVYQSDIIYFGNDLVDYFHKEFRVPCPSRSAEAPRPIRFWDGIIEWNNTPL